QSAAREQEAPAPLADRGQHRRGVTGQLVGGFVLHLAGVLVERDQSGAVALEFLEGDVLAVLWAAAHLNQQQVALDNRCAADAEKVLDDAKLALRIDLPDQLAVAG